MHSSALPLALHDVRQVRDIELAAASELGVSGYCLMQRAGEALLCALRERWPDRRSLTILCGGGNNGGDGYALALLARQAGFTLHVYALAAPESLRGEALQAYQAWTAAGGQTTPFVDIAPPETDALIVDALFGAGLNRPLSGDYAAAADWINRARRPVLAVDAPSGLQADTGAALGDAVRADVTLTFIGLKPGLLTGVAADYCGEIAYSNLGLPAEWLARFTPFARRWIKHPLPPRARAAHKGHFGHVLVIGGNLGFSGAARMAAEAALRSGAGLVSVATRAVHAPLLNLGRPELMCHAVETAADLKPLLEAATVVVIGPGLGQDAWANALYHETIKVNKVCVFDADALNLLAAHTNYAQRRILTPHPGEAGRLLHKTAAQVNQDRYAAAAQLQKRYGGVVVLKGAGTLLAAENELWTAVFGNPGMASGGMGDVLAGIIGGLLAQGLEPLAAAGQGVAVHGEAADRAAARLGERGLLAGDLFVELPVCLRSGE